MVALLPSPVLQFCDANGEPYAGGQINTYVPGTTTPVTTWGEPTGTVANTNPIVLDSAGRCVIYASGIVRFILSDAQGNLIFDQVSNTLVSAAMAPVCIAPDIATAQTLLGIQNNTAALATLTSGLAAANAAITAETTRAEAAEATLTTNLAAANAAIAAETARAEAAEAAIAAGLIKSGTANTVDPTGHVRITFATPFPTACDAFVAMPAGAGFYSISMVSTPDRFGADVWATVAATFATPEPGPLAFYWIAVGH